MVDLFADVPEGITLNTLQTIRRNLDQVGLYGGHTLRKHTDIQILALKTRLTKEDIRYATSYWDVEVANAVVSGIMRKCFDSSITAWLKYSGSDWISLVGQFQGSIKDADTDWGFRILTSYPMFERQERRRG